MEKKKLSNFEVGKEKTVDSFIINFAWPTDFMFICLRRRTSYNRQESELHRKAINYISGKKNRDSVHKITNNFTVSDKHAPYRKLQRIKTTHSRYSVSQTFSLVDPFWLRKITTDPHTLGHVYIECPEYRYPKLNIYISKLILDDTNTYH